MSYYDRLTNEALAERLRKVAGNVRTLPVADRAELLNEAARRLVDPASELMKLKERVRDAAIHEADRRGWCGEFDEIMKRVGIAGRFGNFHVTVKYKVYTGRRDARGTPIYEDAEETKACLARNEQHAAELVVNHFRRHRGYETMELVKVVHDSNVMGQASPAVLNERGRAEDW